MKKIISIIISITMLLSMCNIVLAYTPFSNGENYNIGSTVNGIISETNKETAYQLNLKEAGTISINFIGENIESAYLKIYNEVGQEIWSERPSWNSTSKQISYVADVELTTGIYYFTVSKRYGYGNYDIALNFKSAGETFLEGQNGSDNTFDTAEEIEANQKYIGQIAVNDEIDNYAFKINDSGCVELDFTAQNIESSYLKIYTEDGKEIWSERPSWNSTSKQISYKSKIELTAGTYYFMVSKRYKYGTYEFELNYKSAQETFAEGQDGNNNSFNDAEEIGIDQEYIGQIAINDEIDNYYFSVYDSEVVRLSFRANNIESPYLKIYTEDGQEIWNGRPSWNSTSKHISYTSDITLETGVYYFSVSKRYGYGSYEIIFSISKNKEDKDIDIDIENTFEPEPTPDVSDKTTTSDENKTSFGSSVSEWAKEEVEEAYENDLIPDTIIGEDLTEYINRAEFAAIAVQLYEELSGVNALANKTPFVDVNRNENLEYINKAYVLGITSGTSKTTFEPNVDITREQLATMLCRAIKKYSFEGWTLEKDSDYYLDTGGVSRFSDDSEISDYAKPSVYYMAKFGIIKGVDPTHFAPRNITSYQEATGYATATREQAILMSLRIFNVSEIWQ